MSKFLGLMLLLTSFPLMALEVEYFEFTHSKTYAITDDALLEHSLVNNKYPWMITAAYDYVRVPLSVHSNDRRVGEIVKAINALHLGGGYRPFESLFIGARTYFAQIDAQEKGIFAGDSVIEAKWRFYQDSQSALALAPSIYLPTGSQAFTTNNRKVGEYLGLNFERNFQWFQLSVMAGFANRPGANLDLGSGFSSLDFKQAVYTAAGAIFPLDQAWAINLEGYRYNQLKGNQHPNEVYLGVRHQSATELSSFLGVSMGGALDQTSNDFRLSLGVKYTPGAYETEKVPVFERMPLKVEAPKPVVVKKFSPREEGLKKEQELYGELIASETIYFANGSMKIDHFSGDVVKKFQAQATKLNSPYMIVLEGFSSKKGNPVSNLKLSKDRIAQARSKLRMLGTDDKSISEVAYGDSVADDTVNEALNRKVMLRLYRKKK